MKRLVQLLIIAATLLTVSAQATDSLIDLTSPTPNFLPDETPDEASLSLWERFNDSFPERAQTEFADTFLPFNLIKHDDQGHVRLFDQSFDDAVKMANGAFSDAVSSSFRDAALAMNYPVVVWMRGQEDFFANLLWDSLDSVDEASVSPLDLSYRQTERSWWNRVAKSSRLRFGLRPINSSPYAFLSWRFKNAERVWLLGNLRYRFRGFTDHSFELGLSMPLARRLALDFGTSYRIGREKDTTSLVCKLTKSFSKDSVLFAGLEAQSHPVFVAGLATSW